MPRHSKIFVKARMFSRVWIFLMIRRNYRYLILGSRIRETKEGGSNPPIET